MKKLLLKKANATTHKAILKQHAKRGWFISAPQSASFHKYLQSRILIPNQQIKLQYSTKSDEENHQQQQQQQIPPLPPKKFKLLKWLFMFLVANGTVAFALIKYYGLDKLLPKDILQVTEGEEALYTGKDVHKDRLFGDTYIRFLRAAYTVAYISLDYLITLRGKEGEELEATRKQLHERSAKRLVDAFLKNGGIYIKAGQTIASMNNILPIEYTSAFATCQDQCEKMSFDTFKSVIEEEFNQPITAIFSHLDDKPLAAASLAQVHKGKLTDGSEVAVKVQYPYVRGRLVDDVWTIAFFVNIVTKIFPEFKFKWLLDEFEENLPRELDFEKEASNNERTAKNFAHRNDVSTPKIHWKYTTKRVLTMEFIHGCKINDLDALKKMGLSPVEVSRILSEVFSEQVFRFGFVHCDPHPGNILVRRRNQTTQPELILLDHGLYREMTDDFRMDYCHLWKSVVTMDEPQIMYYAGRLGAADAYELFATMLTSREWDKNNKGFQRELTEEEQLRLKQITFDNIGGIVEVLNNVPRQMLLLFKCNDLLRSVQYDLKVPIVYFSIMARIAQQGLNEQAVRDAQGSAKKVITWAKGVYESTKLDFQLQYYTTMLYLVMFMSRTFGVELVKDNLLMNKMKMLYEK